jgi:hypothetical protein
MIRAYIEDKDPEASLSVGADMRKINLSFILLKVVITLSTYWLLIIHYWLNLLTIDYSLVVIECWLLF